MVIRCILLIAFTFAFLVLVPSHGFSQVSGRALGFVKSEVAKDKSLEQELMRLNKQFIQYELRSDVAAMDSSLSDDYTYTHTNGWIETRSEYLNDYKTG